MTEPAPLTAAERNRLWRWQRRMLVFLWRRHRAPDAGRGADAAVWRAGLGPARGPGLAARAHRRSHVRAISRALPALRPAARLAGAAVLARAVPRLRGGVRAAKLILQSRRNFCAKPAPARGAGSVITGDQ